MAFVHAKADPSAVDKVSSALLFYGPNNLFEGLQGPIL